MSIDIYNWHLVNVSGQTCSKEFKDFSECLKLARKIAKSNKAYSYTAVYLFTGKKTHKIMPEDKFICIERGADWGGGYTCSQRYRYSMIRLREK